MKKERPILPKGITGIVLANKWDENGNIIGVSLYTDREEIYIIAQNKRIKELVSLVQTRVRVEGRLEEGADGLKSIYVETLKTVEKDNEQ
jgi:hypothetical protein